MTNRYYLNKLKIRKKEAAKKEKLEESKKTNITEREFDKAILTSIDERATIINNLEKEIAKSIRIYNYKNREKGYNDTRLVFFRKDSMVWYDVIPRKVGFIQNN